MKVQSLSQMSGFIGICLSTKSINRVLDRHTSRISNFFAPAAPRATEVSVTDIDDSLMPLTEYLDKNLKTLNENLSDTVFQTVILKIWKEVLVTLENLLVPPLSDELSNMKPLDELALHVVFKWLEVWTLSCTGT